MGVDEKFRTEARLLQTVRTDGHEAYAWDTGNTWRYNGSTRAWEVAALPAGVVGETLTLGASGALGWRAAGLGDPTVNFWAGTTDEQTLFTATIAGGTLGPNGAVSVESVAVTGNDTGASTTLFVKSYITPAGVAEFTDMSVSVEITSDVSQGRGIFTFDLLDVGDEVTHYNVMKLRADVSPVIVADTVFASASADFDTGQDWQLRLTAQMDAATWGIGFGPSRLKTEYIP